MPQTDTWLYQLQNVGESEHRGLEAGMDWTPAEWLTAGLDYALVDRRNISHPEIDPTDTPRHRVLASVEYRPCSRLALIPDFEYNSWRYSTSDGVEVAGFWLVNLHARIELSGGWEAGCGVRNIFDKDYELTEGYPEEGRNYYANVCNTSFRSPRNRPKTDDAIRKIDFNALYRAQRKRSSFGSRTAADWDKRAAHRHRADRNNDYNEAFLSRMDLNGATSVLDIGCGSEIWPSPWQNACHGFIALDFSPEMLRYLRLQARRERIATSASFSAPGSIRGRPFRPWTWSSVRGRWAWPICAPRWSK
jgi:hypothetical protein